ncbi:Phytanoyl-CoA dioxygenase (PhyH) [uncultured virus]|nr:Phytanoyl-CoA dioxygenase (PhyH) [uncultured virus]
MFLHIVKQTDVSNGNLVSQKINEIPDLSTLTLPKIKEWAIANGFKVPSGLRKAELIQYLQGTMSERNAGIVKDPKFAIVTLDLLQPRTANMDIDWLTHLHTYGWAVAPIPGWDRNFTQQFFNWFESCSSNFHREDRNTWKAVNMPNMLHGILKHYFGHTEMQWRIRELCAPLFARIWGCQSEDLLCSYDGGCFLPCTPKDALKNSSFKQWVHNDQNRLFRTFCCVQGIVNFEDNDFEDGGLVLVEGSHTIFNEYMARHPSEGIIWGISDMKDPLLSTRNLIKICAPPGHIILFDSRTFHCNVHPFGSLFKEDGTPRFRMCTYVSMMSRDGASVKELQKRISLYEKGRMTGHWCYGPWFKETAEHPHIYGGVNNRPAVIEIAPLNPLRRRLIGYE